jgi:hypothetical protein
MRCRDLEVRGDSRQQRVELGVDILQLQDWWWLAKTGSVLADQEHGTHTFVLMKHGAEGAAIQATSGERNGYLATILAAWS